MLTSIKANLSLVNLSSLAKQTIAIHLYIKTTRNQTEQKRKTRHIDTAVARHLQPSDIQTRSFSTANARHSQPCDIA